MQYLSSIFRLLNRLAHLLKILYLKMKAIITTLSIFALFLSTASAIKAQPTTKEGIKFKFYDVIDSSIVRPMNNYHFEEQHFYSAEKLVGQAKGYSYEITDLSGESSFDKEKCLSHFFIDTYHLYTGHMQIVRTNLDQSRDTMKILTSELNGKIVSMDFQFQKGDYNNDLLYMWTEEVKILPKLWGHVDVTSEDLNPNGFHRKSSFHIANHFATEYEDITATHQKYMNYNVFGEVTEKGTIYNDFPIGKRYLYFNERASCGRIQTIENYNEHRQKNGYIIDYYSVKESSWSLQLDIKQISLYKYGALKAYCFFDIKGKVIDVMGDEENQHKIVKLMKKMTKAQLQN